MCINRVFLLDRHAGDTDTVWHEREPYLAAGSCPEPRLVHAMLTSAPNIVIDL